MKYLIIDIETEVVNGVPSVDDKLKLLAWKDNQGNKGVFTIDELYHIQQKIQNAPIIIGFNIKNYDIPILEKNGCVFKYKIVIDEYEVIKKHVGGIKVLKDLQSYSLASIAEVLKLVNQKQKDFDYTLLNGDDWKNNLNKITEYALQDIETEHELFLWLENFFEPFKYGLNEREIEQYKHITLKTSVYAYKVICRKTGIKEEYNEHVEDYKGEYMGGYVAEPAEELVLGDIYEADFSSAYPHAYMQANLFSNDCKCCKPHEKYDGGHLFSLKGRYCTKKSGVVEEVIKTLYFERLEFKKNNDRKEYAIKILINIIYGICGNPAFKNVYDLNRAADCTYIARESIKYMRSQLELKGYGMLYTDTDSIFIKMNGKTKSELQKDIDDVIIQIKSSMSFPQSTFKMPIDKKIKLLYCPGKKKKNYLYVTDKNELVIKGLKIIKVNSQMVSGVVFEKCIKPLIIKDLIVKFDGVTIKSWIEHELKQDITLAGVKIKATSQTYKNEGQINNQVQKRYGYGTHLLIPNFKIGVGIGVRLCTVKEFIDAGLDISNVNLQQAYNELQMFTNDKLICYTTVKLGGRKRIINTLEQWIK